MGKDNDKGPGLIPFQIPEGTLLLLGNQLFWYSGIAGRRFAIR